MKLNAASKQRAAAALVRLALVLGLSIGVLLMLQAIDAHREDLSSINLTPTLVALIFGLQIVLLWWSMQCWRMVVAGTLNHCISWSSALQHIGIASISKYVPGKVWPFVARAMVAERSGMSKSAIVGASIYEQVLTLAVGTTLGIALYAPIDSIIAKLAFAASTLLAIVPVINLLTSRLDSITARIPWIAQRLPKGLVPRQVDMATTGKLVVAYSLLWCLTGTIAAAVLAISGIAPTAPVAIQLTAAVMLSVCAGFVVLLAPGGLGVREGALVLLLTAPLGASTAIQFAVLLRVWNVAYDLFAGGVAALSFAVMKAPHPSAHP